MKYNRILSMIAGACLLLVAESKAQDSNNPQQRNNDQAAVNTDNKTPTKIAEYIVGTWRSEGSRQGSNNIISNGGDETIQFDREARYMRKSGDQITESGSYRMNENHSIIYLESETSEKPKEFGVAFKDDQMILTMKENQEQGHEMSYVYTRTSNASERVDKSGNTSGKN